MPERPDVMRAAAIDRFGGPDELAMQPLPVPDIDDDEILLDIRSAGVGVWDAWERQGAMKDRIDGAPTFPYVLGSDGAGTVAAVGADVDRFSEGDRVYASSFLNPKGGFYAEYAAVPADRVAPIPSGLDFEEAGALPADGVTALRGLRDELKVEEGDSLLVFGASGGVGHLAVQLANRMGAHVLAIASGGDGVDLVTDLGASEVVEGREEDPRDAMRRLAPNGLDAALITASGEGLETALSGLREGARATWPNGVTPTPDVPDTVESSSYDGAPDPDILRALNTLIDSGPFEVHVDETFPLPEASDAHRALEEHHPGKLCLRVED